MELSDIREEIDEIDRQLLPLLLQRMNCARKVAASKKRSGAPVYNAAREEEILDHMEQAGGEFGGALRTVYGTIISESRALQHRLLQAGQALRALVAAAPKSLPHLDRVACLGGEGSYSHEMLRHLYPQAKPVFCGTFPQVFATVEQGRADLGLVPVENSNAGSVSEVYALLLRYRYYLVAAGSLRVRHCLANRSGQRADIRTVCSKRIALAQCAQLLADLHVPTRATDSTAAAAAYAAAHPEAAALCSEKAALANGLQILARQVQDSPDNRTRFAAFSRELCIPDEANKISLCFNLPHRRGSLNAVLSRFAATRMNLTKIESRPIAGRDFEYDFYLDFTGNLHEQDALELLCSLQDELPSFSFLGNYREFGPV